MEQDRLQSFLKTAELLRIKGLTDGLPDTGGGAREVEEEVTEQSDPEGKLIRGEVKLSRTPVLLRLLLEY